MATGTKGKLIAMLAMSALIAPNAIGQTGIAVQDIASAPPEHAEAYEIAVAQGPAALRSFMERYPTSPLIPAVIRALAEDVGVETAIQIALDAGVPTAIVFDVAAALSTPLTTATGQVAAAAAPY